MLRSLSRQASALATVAALALTAPGAMAMTPELADDTLTTPLSAQGHFLDDIITERAPEDLLPNEVWVRIDLAGREMSVYRGSVEIEEFDYLAFGSSGFQDMRLEGSRQTPIGEFRVDRINPKSRFRRFYGIDYPNKAVADKALEAGLISPREHDHIHRYIDRHGMAPADTSLGGYIGIHGVGRGDPLVHQTFDWTEGCVAVSNSEIMALSHHLKIGTRVVITG